MTTEDSPRARQRTRFRPSADQILVRVTLECEHAVKTRNHPAQERAKYVCTAGLGCGYNLWWVTAEEGGRISRNLMYEEHKKQEET